MTKMDVLDHGSVELVESWGSDERIVETARVSTQKGFLGWGEKVVCGRCGGRKTFVAWGDSDRDDEDDPSRPCPACRGAGERVEAPGDEKLLSYLASHHHDTPFEFAGATFEVQAPIFVFREWHRHRTQSYSEASARYAPLPDVNYVPEVRRVFVGTTANKQAGTIKGANELTADAVTDLLNEERDLLVMVEDLYQRKLKAGFPKELARTHLTVSRYSRMRASANLRNWVGFLRLRLDETAQWEIRQYAKAIRELLAEAFPRAMNLLVDGGDGAI
jgi:thymidylate synthase (FAD)